MVFVQSHKRFSFFFLHHHYLFALVTWPAHFISISVLNICCILCFNIACVCSLCTKLCGHNLFEQIVIIITFFSFRILAKTFKQNIGSEKPNQYDCLKWINFMKLIIRLIDSLVLYFVWILFRCFQQSSHISNSGTVGWKLFISNNQRIRKLKTTNDRKGKWNKPVFPLKDYYFFS